MVSGQWSIENASDQWGEVGRVGLFGPIGREAKERMRATVAAPIHTETRRIFRTELGGNGGRTSGTDETQMGGSW